MGTKTLHLPASVRSGGVALPKRVENEVLREQAQLVQEMIEVTGSMLHYTRELQHRFDDPYLKVILAHPHTTIEGLKPNYYHVIRFEPGRPVAIMPVEDEKTGARLELGEHVFTMVAKADLQNDRTQRMLREERDKKERDRQKAKIQRSMDRAAEFDDRLDHAVNLHISIPRSIKNA